MAFLFPFEPNWASPFKVDLKYKTEVITSRNYKEQRFALRTQPRKSLSFTISPSRGKLMDFLALMSRRQQSECVVEEVTRRAFTLGVSVALGNTMQLTAPAPVWAKVGSWIVFTHNGVRDFRQLSGVADDLLVFDDPLTVDFPAGGIVSPGLVGRLDQALRGSAVTNTVGQFTIDFEADPGLNFYQAEESAPELFNGRELFLTRPNWRTAPTISLDGLLETLDFERGRVEHHEAVTFNNVSCRMEFIGRNTEEAEALAAFVHRLKGQQGEFYAPTWLDDFDLSIGASLGASVLPVPGLGAASFYGSSTVYKAAIAFFRDGTRQANRITGVAAVGGQSEFTFEDPWSLALNDTTVRLMSFLPVWRLAIDTLSFSWLTRTVCQTQLTAKSLEDEE